MRMFTTDIINDLVVRDADILIGDSRDRWLDYRKIYITATDVAAILGLSPWAKPVDIAMKKRGLAPEVVQNDAMRWGLLLEDVVADEYSLKVEAGVKSIGAHSVLVSQKHHWLAGTPDFLCYKNSEMWGVEIKTASRAEGWAESASTGDEWEWNKRGDIPDHYYAQIQTYLAILSHCKRWDVAVLIGGSDFRMYRFQRDEAMIETILEVCKSFYDTYVADQTTELDPAFIAESLEAVKARWPISQPDKVINVDRDSHFIDAACYYTAASEHIKAVEERKSLVRGKIVSTMQDAEKAVFEGGSVSYKTTKPTVKIDHERKNEILTAKVSSLLTAEQRKELKDYMATNADRYTVEIPGYRRLLVTIKDKALLNRPAVPQLEVNGGQSIVAPV